MDPISSEFFRNPQVDLDSLPRVEEVDYTSLSPRYLVKLQIISFLSALIFLSAAGIGYLVAPPFRTYLLALAVFLFLLFCFSCFRNVRFVQRSGYAMRERDIIFKRGFLHERTTVVPFNRIQHVSLERSFLDKILDLGTVKVFTAGGSGSDISIPGIPPGKAAALKEAVSERIFSHV